MQRLEPVTEILMLPSAHIHSYMLGYHLTIHSDTHIHDSNSRFFIRALAGVFGYVTCMTPCTPHGKLLIGVVLVHLIQEVKLMTLVLGNPFVKIVIDDRSSHLAIMRGRIAYFFADLTPANPNMV